jgi:hypothetical protein
VLLGKQLAGATEPRVDLVEDRHHVIRVAEFAHVSKIPGWRDDDAGFPWIGLIDHLKKGDMAKEAERLLGSGWLPEPLRLVDVAAAPAQQEGEAGPLPEFLSDQEEREAAANEDRPQLDAAE